MLKLIFPVLILASHLSYAGSCRVDMSLEHVSPSCTEYSAVDTEYSAGNEVMSSLQSACESSPYSTWSHSSNCYNSSYGCQIDTGDIVTTVWYDKAFDKSTVISACNSLRGKFRSK